MGNEIVSWESYFYPETYDSVTRQGTLRNLFDERDALVLSHLEMTETARRVYDLELDRVDIPRTFDARHLKAIHLYIFQEVYEWAGQFRRVNISKGPTHFADVQLDMINHCLEDLNNFIQHTSWSRLNRHEFTRDVSLAYALLNYAHPFREGNGRTAKIFLNHLSELSEFRFNFALVSPHDWNMASMLSGPDIGSTEVVPDSLVPIFEAVTYRRQ